MATSGPIRSPKPRASNDLALTCARLLWNAVQFQDIGHNGHTTECNRRLGDKASTHQVAIETICKSAMQSITCASPARATVAKSLMRLRKNEMLTVSRRGYSSP